MKIVYDGSMDPRLCKSVLGETIPALAAEDPDFIYLDADLMNCIGTAKWAAANPDRAINCGIAEANMIGVACGLAAAGFKPMVHTFGPFASRRCYDQLFLSAGYAKNDITIIGTDPGVTAAMNGGTHMPFEDMALYRAIPGATVIDVTDPTMLISVLRQSKDRPGVKYIRVGRKSYARVYEEGSELPIGKAVTLREGTDLVIFACGILIHEAMQAAKILAEEGISAAVVDCFTVKPLDEEAVLAWAGKTGAVGRGHSGKSQPDRRPYFCCERAAGPPLPHTAGGGGCGGLLRRGGSPGLSAAALRPHSGACDPCCAGGREEETDEMKLEFGMGSGVQTVELPEKNLMGVLRANAAPAIASEEEEVRRALREPVGSPRLREILHPGQTVAIITSDLTRPMPTAKVMPPLLDELYAAGIRPEDITLVFALGSHRHQSDEELRAPGRHQGGNPGGYYTGCGRGGSEDLPGECGVSLFRRLFRRGQGDHAGLLHKGGHSVESLHDGAPGGLRRKSGR